MSDIFQEVEEDLRRERMQSLWDRYAVYVIAVALLVVAGVAGWRGWEWYSSRQASEASSRFAAAIAQADAGQSDAAQAALETMATDAPSGYVVLARFRAAAEIGRGDAAAGIAAYEGLAGDGSVEQPLRELATLRAGLLELQQGAGYDALLARLEPLTAATGTWRHSAREVLAFGALAADNDVDARRWAEAAVADSEAPPGVRNRAQIVIELLADQPAAAT